MNMAGKDGGSADNHTKPLITKLGTITCDLVEATPVVWRDKLYRYEYVRPARVYKPNTTGDTYFRFIDVESGEASPGFAAGYHLGCAQVEGERLFAFGTNASGGDEIRVFRSDDMEHWDSRTALHLPGWTLFNTSVCASPAGYTMAFEVGGPPELVGERFTIFFAQSPDLLAWEVLPPQDHAYTKERYSACPAIRYLDGYYYMIYLEAIPPVERITYELYIARSPDLVEWEPSPHNPLLARDEDDRKLYPGAAFTEQEKERIGTALNINNSDFDFCEFEGRTVMTYSWGCQGYHQTGPDSWGYIPGRECTGEYLAGAAYDGPPAQFLKGWFPE